MTSLMRDRQYHVLVVGLAIAMASCHGSIKMRSHDAGTSGEDSGDQEVGEPDVDASEPTDDGDEDGGSADDEPTTTINPVVTGQVESTAPTNTGLPTLPRLTNVKASAMGDSVSISFDPFDGAVDYRVYELPDPKAVSVSGDGHVSIQKAVYRCAGNRQVPPAIMDGAAQVQSGAVKTLVEGQSVAGYVRSLADATLGYVFAEPGAGRVPVYALGDSAKNADNSCFFQRWTASRAKQYVTTTAARDALLDKGFRDDGIAFYVPEAESAATRQVFTSTAENTRFYFVTAAEQAARKNASMAFGVLANQAEGTLPLKRVFYSNGCGMSHDELVAGDARFQLARKQGDRLPISKLHWSGLKGPTTLVVEALDAGCPFQGLIGPKAFTGKAPYQSWLTPEDVQKSAANNELFINGQFDGTKPRPIARAFLKIAPGTPPELDWSYGFDADDDFGSFMTVGCGVSNCYTTYRMKTDVADTLFHSIEADRYAQRAAFGEWWVMYSDTAADTNGKYRLTATTKADLAGDSFLYVSMEVDAFTTSRRYPQILISDRDIPVQYGLPQGNTLVIQTFGDWPYRYELQICDHKNWDVNDQCPRFDFYNQRDPNDANKLVGLAPNVEVGEQVGMDYGNRFEVYASAKRAYLFLDGRPYGCANLPKAGVPSGAVTVTYGDVLYHSGVDLLFDYTKRSRQLDAFRHFDNLGFKSHVPAPAWNHTRLPCTGHLLD